MANFQTAPTTVLKQVPHWLPADIQDVLRQPGTYALTLTDGLKLPKGNGTWKGPQARLVAVWGGADGQRLDVVPLTAVIRADPLIPAYPPPPDNVYVYLVRFLTDDLNGQCVGGTMLEGRLPADSAKWGKKGSKFTCLKCSSTWLPTHAFIHSYAVVDPNWRFDVRAESNRPKT